VTDTRAAAVVGVGETPFLRRSDQALDEAVFAAITAALADAGIAACDVDGLVTEASMMPQRVPADMVATAFGMSHRCFTAHSLVGGAGVVGAVGLAAAAIRAGFAKTVVTYYGVDFGSSVGGPYAFPAGLDVKLGYEAPFGWYGQPLYFAGLAQRYRHEYGLTPEQQGAVAIAAHRHAANTPGAMSRGAITMEQYLASRMICEPFRALDCSLINDGAVALVVTSAQRAADLPHTPVAVAGAGFASSLDTQGTYFTQHDPYLCTPAVLSAEAAFAGAGLTPDDVDVAEIYDCFTISTILQLEDLGFCAKGEGASFVENGRIELGGALPVNTHGGLLAHSYLVGASHLVEAVRQLRHERGAGQVPGAEVALVAGLGLPDHATVLLARSR
jgi:acetyl-CoA acetyltransferase